MTHRQSLFVLIPVLIALAVLTVTGVHYALARVHGTLEVRREARESLAEAARRLVPIARPLARAPHGDAAAAPLRLSDQAAGIELAALVDAAGTVIGANEPDRIGRALADLEPLEGVSSGGLAALSTEPTELVRRRLMTSAHAVSLPCDTPLPPLGCTGPRASVPGSLVLAADLTGPLAAARRAALHDTALAFALVSLVALGGWLVALVRFHRPLRRLVRTARALAAGELDASADVSRRDELGEIAAALDALAAAERERAEARRANARLARIVESVADEIYVIDAASRRLIEANRAARANLGRDRDACAGLDPFEFIDGVTRDEFDATLDALERDRGAVRDLEAVHRRVDGTSYPVRARVQHLPDQSPPAFVAIVEDLSDRRRRATSVWLRNRALEAVDVGLSITDARRADYPFVYVNRALCELTGYAVDELLGRPATLLQRADPDQPAHAAIGRAQALGQAVRVTLRSTRKDGSRYTDELSLSPVHDERGTLTHYIGVNRDVTDELEGRARRARAERMESIGMLAGGVAHDFNNHLNVIVGNLEFVDAELPDERLRPLLTDAREAAAMGARLTRRLLAFAGREAVEMAAVDVREASARAVALLGPTIGETIRLELAPDAAPGRTLADPSELENAVVNLVVNARDALPEGGAIAVSTALVDAGAGDRLVALGLAPGRYVRLRVADDGTGMSEAVRARAVEPFFTTKEVGRGTGLGLASVHAFAERCGGLTEIASRPGEGTVVDVYLPRARDEEAVDIAPGRSGEPGDGRAARVLAVEDDPRVRQLTVRRLEALGHEVVAVEDAVRAVAALERGEAIDLVLSDVAMPGEMSGHDLARWVRTHRPGLPVLLSSGHGELGGVESGPSDVAGLLPKPYGLERLREAVREALSGAPPPGGREARGARPIDDGLGRGAIAPGET